MHESTQAETFGPVDQDSSLGGLVHVEKIVGLSIEKERIDLPETYQPSDGSWSEFVWDTKKSLSKVSTSVKERVADARESWSKILHRKTTQRV